MSQWRVGRLRKPGKPLFVPGVEPVVGVVGREENVQIRVIGRCRREFHQQQRTMNRKGQ